MPMEELENSAWSLRSPLVVRSSIERCHSTVKTRVRRRILLLLTDNERMKYLKDAEGR